MVFRKCQICKKGFRATHLKEKKCAECEVNHCPIDECTEKAFLDIAVEHYRENPFRLPPDVFDHKNRLANLKSSLNSFPGKMKETRKRERIVDRLQEENDIINKKLEEIQSRFLAVALLHSSCNPLPTSSNVPTKEMTLRNREDHDQATLVKQDTTEKDDMEKLNSIKKRSQVILDLTTELKHTDESNSKANNIVPSICTIDCGEKAMRRKSEMICSRIREEEDRFEINNNKRMTVKDEENSVEPKSSPGIAKSRCNSVKIRIKAFEELTRRASTGGCRKRTNMPF